MDKPELVPPFTLQVGLSALLVIAFENLWGAAGRSGYLGGCLPSKENKLDLYPHPFIGCFGLWRGGEGIQGGSLETLCLYSGTLLDL